MIRLAPVYLTADLSRTGDFLAALGFAVEAEHRKGGWATWSTRTTDIKSSGKGRACRF